MKWLLNNKTYWPETGSIINKQKRVVEERATEKLTGNWTCVLRGWKEGQVSANLFVRGETLSWKSESD